MGMFMQILILAGLVPAHPPKRFLFMSFLFSSTSFKISFFFSFPFCCSTPCCGPRLRLKCVRLLPFFRTSLRSTLFCVSCVSTYEPFLLRTALTRTSSSCPLPLQYVFTPPSILQNSTHYIIHAQCMTKDKDDKGRGCCPHTTCNAMMISFEAHMELGCGRCLLK